MAVKSLEDNNKLILTLDNGDKEKFKQLLSDWNFKNEQSLLRFAMSVMIETKDKKLGIINEDNEIEEVVPADHLIKKNYFA